MAIMTIYSKLFETNPPLPSDEVVEFRGVLRRLSFSEKANKPPLQKNKKQKVRKVKE